MSIVTLQMSNPKREGMGGNELSNNIIQDIIL